MRRIKTLMASLALVVGFSAPVLAEDLLFQFNNDTSRAVAELYLSPSNTGAWEEDILGMDMLPSGQNVNVNVMDGRDVCSYDIQVVMEDGAVMEDYGIDLCDLGEYTVYE